jgi:hypothetical protein
MYSLVANLLIKKRDLVPSIYYAALHRSYKFLMSSKYLVPVRKSVKSLLINGENPLEDSVI